MENPQIELNVADQILENGVPMKIRAPFFLRWLGKKTITLRVHAPCIGTMQRVSAYYLSTGIRSEQLTDITHEQALGMMMVHGKAIRRAVACAWLNGYWSGKWLTRPLATYLKWHCRPTELCNVATLMLIYGGVADFMDTTRSVRLMKVTSPNLGQTVSGS